MRTVSLECTNINDLLIPAKIYNFTSEQTLLFKVTDRFKETDNKHWQDETILTCCMHIQRHDNIEVRPLIFRVTQQFVRQNAFFFIIHPSASLFSLRDYESAPTYKRQHFKHEK